MSNLFINEDDIGNVILDYIASEEFGRWIREEDRNGFISGLGFAGTLIYARCRKYVQTEKEEKNEFMNEQGKVQDKVQDIDVIHCKDCVYYMNDARQCLNDLINADMIIEPDWFCANAVRKDYDDCRN